MMSLKKFLFQDYEWERQPCSNKKGYRFAYRYQGVWQQWDRTGRRLLYTKIATGFTFLLCSLLFLYGGTLSCGLNRTKTVQAGTLLALCAVVFLLAGVLLFIFSGKKMTRADAILQHALILWSAKAAAAVLLFTIGYAVVFQGDAIGQADILVLACYAAAAGSAILLLLMHKKLNAVDV